MATLFHVRPARAMLAQPSARMMPMKTLTALLLTPALALLALSAQADMYKWTDANGRVFFGDKPPSGARNAVNLSPAAAAAPAPQEAARPAEPAAAKPAPNKDSRSMMERQKRMADILQQENEEREAAAKKAAEEKAERRRNCNILRDYQKNMAGARVYDLDEKGERVYIDGQQRSELDNNIRDRIGENCE